MLGDFLSIDLHGEVFSWGQGKAHGFSRGSVDHYKALFGPALDEVDCFLHPDGCSGHLFCFGPKHKVLCRQCPWDVGAGGGLVTEVIKENYEKSR